MSIGPGSRVDYPEYPGEWALDALCTQVDPETFFPEKGQSTRDAKRTCRACPVRAECLTYALDTKQRFGVWGGLSERDRRRLLANQGIHLDTETPAEEGTAA